MKKKMLRSVLATAVVALALAGGAAAGPLDVGWGTSARTASTTTVQSAGLGVVGWGAVTSADDGDVGWGVSPADDSGDVGWGVAPAAGSGDVGWGFKAVSGDVGWGAPVASPGDVGWSAPTEAEA
jgi:hypothetical protein